MTYISVPRYCHTCRTFGDHWSDQHPRTYNPDPWGEVADAVWEGDE